MRERWGSFSVKDHIHTNNLASDVLMYDRLIFPVPPNEDERERWEKNNWQPDLLNQRLEQIGSRRAIKIKWDKYRQEQFGDQMERIQALTQDSKTIVPASEAYQMTRTILSQDEILKPLHGSSNASVVAAYQSLYDLRRSYTLHQDQNINSALCLCIRNRLTLPVFSTDQEKNLKLSIQLSDDSEYIERRRALYAWQDNILKDEVKLADALDELEEHIEKYNKCVKSAEKNVVNKFIISVVGAAIVAPITTTLVATPSATLLDLLVTYGPSGLISLGGFLTFDKNPVVNSGEAQVAAMFHDVARTFN